eukprot:CAMPEP_0194063924 /NCGR_PEP_ID=MMETSP0009_2-20130614/81614_1 /TAXON_ID=210454 /ORGANISM="Grammatophora oceanica, Strain CCMP 410" /LENGTH=101 /DNA_ID=CAMNT_0038716219 /DNA_START=17 /DNA_END=322 /DNA_ORIENTATION=+
MVVVNNPDLRSYQVRVRVALHWRSYQVLGAQHPKLDSLRSYRCSIVVGGSWAYPCVGRNHAGRLELASGISSSDVSWLGANDYYSPLLDPPAASTLHLPTF